MMARVGVVTVLLAVLLPLCLADTADYSVDQAPWPSRGLRSAPSLRLRFGKRGNKVWGLSQRSLPSLKMRFGKRAWPVDDMSMSNKGDEEGRMYTGEVYTGDAYTGDMFPGDAYTGERQRRDQDLNSRLRMRFGKRDVEDASVTKELSEALGTSRQ